MTGNSLKFAILILHACCLLITRMRILFCSRLNFAFAPADADFLLFVTKNIKHVWYLFICHEWQKHRKSSPHTRKICRSNLLRITSARCKFTSGGRLYPWAEKKIYWSLVSVCWRRTLFGKTDRFSVRFTDNSKLYLWCLHFIYQNFRQSNRVT